MPIAFLHPVFHQFLQHFRLFLNFLLPQCWIDSDCHFQWTCGTWTCVCTHQMIKTWNSWFFLVLSPSFLNVSILSFMHGLQLFCPKDFMQLIGFPFQTISIFTISLAIWTLAFTFLSLIIVANHCWELHIGIQLVRIPLLC